MLSLDEVVELGSYIINVYIYTCNKEAKHAIYKCIYIICKCYYLAPVLEGFSDRRDRVFHIDKVTNGVRNAHKPSYKVGLYQL